MPVWSVTTTYLPETDDFAVRILPDLKAPITPRYCPDAKVLRKRTKAERAQALDALEARSTMVAA